MLFQNDIFTGHLCLHFRNWFSAAVLRKFLQSYAKLTHLAGKRPVYTLILKMAFELLQCETRSRFFLAVRALGQSNANLQVLTKGLVKHLFFAGGTSELCLWNLTWGEPIQLFFIPMVATARAACTFLAPLIDAGFASHNFTCTTTYRGPCDI
jgi:hypothetical protein